MDLGQREKGNDRIPQWLDATTGRLLTLHCPKQATWPSLISIKHKIQSLSGKGRKLLEIILWLKRLSENVFIQTTDHSTIFFTEQ